MVGIKNKVPLVVVGGDFRMVSSSWRASSVLTDEERRSLLDALRRDEPELGFASVDTCNRTEWIVSTYRPEWVGNLLRAHMVQRWAKAFPDSKILPEPYVFTKSAAARHIFRVAVGLESFVVGEAQISGQFNRALESARSEGASSPHLNRLGVAIGHMVSDVNKIGFQTDRHRGVHGLALDFLKEHLKHEQPSVLVIGMGEIGRRLAATIDELTDWKLVRANRSVSDNRAEAWRSFNELPQLLKQVDAAVICTGAREPVMKRSHFAMLERTKPILVVDLGIPQQVEMDVCVEDGALLVGLDELMAQSRHSNPENLEKVEMLVTEGVGLFERYCRELQIASLLDSTQRRHKRSINEIVPKFVKSQLSTLPEAERRKIEISLNGLFRDYTNDMFKAIHTFLESGEDNK